MNVAALFDELGVRRTGHFRLSSGRHSDTYLQCATALSQPRTALALGAALAEQVPGEVDVVASPALGGLLAGFAVAAALDRRFVFAERPPGGAFALRRGQAVEAGERVLVVEDVVTTGGSALEVAGLITGAGGTVTGIACLVDRSGQRLDPAPISLLRVGAQAWDEQACPLCAVGAPLDRPGSRLDSGGEQKVQIGPKER
jgi:orotate phosphoribosyltransferase